VLTLETESGPLSTLWKRLDEGEINYTGETQKETVIVVKICQPFFQMYVFPRRW